LSDNFDIKPTAQVRSYPLQHTRVVIHKEHSDFPLLACHLKFQTSAQLDYLDHFIIGRISLCSTLPNISEY
jgi:hypothetical protein